MAIKGPPSAGAAAKLVAHRPDTRARSREGNVSPMNLNMAALPIPSARPRHRRAVTSPARPATRPTPPVQIAQRTGVAPAQGVVGQRQQGAVAPALQVRPGRRHQPVDEGTDQRCRLRLRPALLPVQPLQRQADLDGRARVVQPGGAVEGGDAGQVAADGGRRPLAGQGVDVAHQGVGRRRQRRQAGRDAPGGERRHVGTQGALGAAGVGATGMHGVLRQVGRHHVLGRCRVSPLPYQRTARRVAQFCDGVGHGGPVLHPGLPACVSSRFPPSCLISGIGLNRSAVAGAPVSVCGLMVSVWNSAIITLFA